MSHSQVGSAAQSDALIPSLLPFLFSVGILADEGVVLSLVDPAQGLWSILGVQAVALHCCCSDPWCLGTLQSTYCATMVQHCEALHRSVQVVNLDPAAEHFNYSVMAGESSAEPPPLQEN